MSIITDKDVCNSCEQLEKYNFDFVQKGITDDMRASLKKDKGLKSSNGFNNCKDLNDMNDCLIGGMVERIPSYNSCDLDSALMESLNNIMQMLDAIIGGDCGQWENIWEIWDEINKIKERLDDVERRLNTRLDTLEETTGKINSALSKLLQNLADSGAWNHTDGNIFDGYLNANRNIATGNINLFGGTQDGSSFIRTNNGETENDLVGGV